MNREELIFNPLFDQQKKLIPYLMTKKKHCIFNSSFFDRQINNFLDLQEDSLFDDQKKDIRFLIPYFISKNLCRL